MGPSFVLVKEEEKKKLLKRSSELKGEHRQLEEKDRLLTTAMKVSPAQPSSGQDRPASSLQASSGQASQVNPEQTKPAQLSPGSYSYPVGSTQRNPI